MRLSISILSLFNFQHRSLGLLQSAFPFNFGLVKAFFTVPPNVSNRARYYIPCRLSSYILLVISAPFSSFLDYHILKL
jgi:hypothetical protein